MSLIMITILLLSLISAADCSSERELVFVQAAFRHGDRAPLDLPYPNDENTEKSWTGGWGSLTDIGKEEAMDLGRFFRLRYPGFISGQYNESEVFMLSSSVNRTVLSAENVFRGMYPNCVPPKVSTHDNGPEESRLLVRSSECKITKKRIDRDRTRTVNENDKRYADVYKFLEPLTGYKNFGTFDMAALYEIQNEIIHNMSVPNWVHKRWPRHYNRTTLDIATEIRTLLWMNKYDNVEKSKGDGGFLLYTWINDSLNVAKGEKVEKLKLYSTHDNKILALMYTMGIGNGVLVPYAATVIWELYKNGDNYEVEVYYRNETFTDSAHLLKIPGCGCPCLLWKLPELYKNATFSSLDERKKYCYPKWLEELMRTTTVLTAVSANNPHFYPKFLTLLSSVAVMFMY